jgi:hypothetical protein
MAAIDPPGPSAIRWTRVALQTLLIVALPAIAGFVWLRGQPERLTTVRGENVKVSGDHLYRFGFQNPYLRSDPILQAQSIHAPGMRTLVAEDSAYRFVQPYTLGLAGGSVYYAVEPRSNPVPAQDIVNSAPGRYFGTFLLQPKTASTPGRIGQTRTRVAPTPLPVQETRFRRVSVQGGTPAEAAALRGERFCLIAEHVFWIRPALEETVQVVQGGSTGDRSYWFETTPHSDLMLTSLADGTTRCIRTGISRLSNLTSAEFGVTWTEFAAFPHQSTLFYARASDGAVRALPRPARDQRVTPLLEFGDRFYWTISSYEADAFRNYHDTLMSSKTDGTDVREVLAQVDRRFLSNFSLTVYGGALYCRVDALPLTRRGQLQVLLCRLYPERPDPLEILRKLPAGFSYASQFEGGYLYFVVRESGRSLWASLTSDLPARPTFTLCRVPLR